MRIVRKSGRPMEDFYDKLSPFYHLIYQDWEASIERQGAQLNRLIQDRCSTAKDVLDVACGIGTQSIGLAAQGFNVTGSDLSPQSIERARVEARSRGLDIKFSVCDMLQIEAHHHADFDVVICADNALPHLLSDQQILLALRGMYSRLRPGGALIITMRDYDKVERGKGLVHPYGIRESAGSRYLVWQVWDFEDDQYDLSMYLVEDNLRDSRATTHVLRTRYYAISPANVLALMAEAGFERPQKLDDAFFQPVLIAHKGI